MANGLYNLTRKLFCDGDIDLLADDIKVVLVRTASGTNYTVDLDAHDYLADIAAGARVATSGNLAGKTTTGGVFDATDISFTAVAADVGCCLVIYKDTGDAATSPLIAYIDTGTGLPVVPDGNDVDVTWSAGANKIFKL